MRSSSFAIRCAFFNGIDSVTQTRQLIPPEKPLGSLQLHLQIGTGLPQVLCHSSQREQTPQVVKDTSNATRQPCADNQVSPHPSSYTSHAALSQKVSCTSVPGELFSPDTHWKVGLTIWKKKHQTHFWGTDGFFCLLSSVPNHIPFSFLICEEKWASDLSLTWPSQIHLDPDYQTEINKKLFLSLFVSFLHLFPTWTFHSSAIYQDCGHIL